MEKNVAGKWTVFAYGLPDHANPGQPITGDAANITANIRIDGGIANAVDDTNPTELEDGYYIFDITATENNGNLISIHPASSTANVQVIGVPGAVYTTPPNFNDLGIETDGDLTQVNTCVANSDMRGTDSAATALALSTAQADLDTLTGSDGVTLATAQANYAPAKATDIVSAGAITTLAGAVVNVDTVDTCTTNTDMRGTDSANTTTPPTAAAIADAVCDEALSGHVTAGSVGKAISDIETDTNELQTNQGNWLTATGFSTHSAADVWTSGTRTLTSFGTLISDIWASVTRTLTAGTKDSEIDAILTDTATTIPNQIGALNDISPTEVNAEVLDVLTTDTFAEPTGVPGTTVSLSEKIGRIYQALRNKVDVTATKKTFHNNADTAIWEKDVSDDGTTYSESKGNAI